ncbi:MAG: phosphoenolpyruvate--protein phosphotransferase [Chloroflexota bacterium]|nr:phosphoenolpyruvate--protein phosphotransferase [Chloroflexota bacterium]
MQTVTGIPASKGIAIGPGFLYQTTQAIPDRRTVADVKAELEHFRLSCAKADKELEKLYSKAVESVGEEAAEIFEAHRMMLQDPELVQYVEDAILNEELAADFAMYEAGEMNAKMMEALEDEYFKARAADIRDVARRVLRILHGKEDQEVNLKQPSIILADDLAPSDTMQFERTLILGFFTARGGTTSHTAILSKAMGIPAVVGGGKIPSNLKPGSVLIIDGDNGKLIIDPDQRTLTNYHEKQEEQLAQYHQEMQSAHDPATTKDGHEVEVVANIGNRLDAEDAVAKGAEGVGLLRTEFSFIEENVIPDEEDLVKTYQEMFSPFGDDPVIVRTLDIGGDKDMPHLKLPVESNPFLGCRGIRLCFDKLDLFKLQLRAILRAGESTNLCIMFPMVATVDEVMQSKTVLKEVMETLKSEDFPFNHNPQVGIMIEVPSAAVCADQLAKVVNFFSIGTNDLTQYTMAADRTNAAVAYLISAMQPAVIRLVAKVIEDGHAAGIWVGMCGEMAGDVTAIPILLGLGLDEFSMTSPLIPAAKEIIRKWDTRQAKLLAEQAMSCQSPQEVKELVENWQIE